MMGLALAWWLGGAAWACATCAAGDPTLTVMGLEKPVRGRLRLSTQASYRWERQPSADVVDQVRGELGLSWTAARWLVLSGSLPLVSSAVRGADLSEERGTGLGDLELRSRFVVGASRLRTHLGGLVAGLALPTSPAVHLPDGDLAPDDVQTGTGSWTPVLGAWHGAFAGAWSTFTSAVIRTSTEGHGARSPGVVGLATLAVQWQPHPVVAPRLAVDARVAAADRVGDQVDHASGGWLVQLTPALLVAPAADWLLQASVAVPVAQGAARDAREGVSAWVALVVDL